VVLVARDRRTGTARFGLTPRWKLAGQFRGVAPIDKHWLVGPHPARAGSGVRWLYVVSIRPAEFNDMTRELVAKRLFRHWLDQRRKVARIELFGEPARPRAPTPA
jgi:hypothetical protein